MTTFISPSEVYICNLALLNIGETQFIQSLTESTREAEVLSKVYPLARDSILQEAPWNFAKRVKILASQTNDSEVWDYKYEYPVDCLKLRYIMPNLADSSATAEGSVHAGYRISAEQTIRIPFEVLSDGDDSIAIYTSEEEARAVYTVRVTNPSLYPAPFMDALSWLIAAKIVTPLALGKKNLAENALANYQSILDSAKAKRLQEQVRPEPPQSEFVRARTDG